MADEVDESVLEIPEDLALAWERLNENLEEIGQDPSYPLDAVASADNPGTLLPDEVVEMLDFDPFFFASQVKIEGEEAAGEEDSTPEDDDDDTSFEAAEISPAAASHKMRRANGKKSGDSIELGGRGSRGADGGVSGGDGSCHGGSDGGGDGGDSGLAYAEGGYDEEDDYETSKPNKAKAGATSYSKAYLKKKNDKYSKQLHKRKEPKRNEFSSDDDYMIAWQKWRRVRDLNNEAVKRCRENIKKKRQVTPEQRLQEADKLEGEVKGLYHKMAMLVKALKNRDELTEEETAAVNEIVENTS